MDYLQIIGEATGDAIGELQMPVRTHFGTGQEYTLPLVCNNHGYEA